MSDYEAKERAIRGEMERDARESRMKALCDELVSQIESQQRRSSMETNIHMQDYLDGRAAGMRVALIMIQTELREMRDE